VFEIFDMNTSYLPEVRVIPLELKEFLIDLRGNKINVMGHRINKELS